MSNPHTTAVAPTNNMFVPAYDAKAFATLYQEPENVLGAPDRRAAERIARNRKAPRN